MVVKGYRVGVLLKRTAKEIAEDRVTALAAQAAYNFFFSLFPLFLFLAPLLSLVVERQTLMQFVTSRIAGAVPAQAAAAIDLVLRDVVFASNAPGLVSIGALLAAWSGSNIFGTLGSALNTAYDVEERRPWWKQQLLRFAMLVVGGTIIIVATLVMLGGEGIARTVGGWIGAGPVATKVWTVAQYPLAFGFLVLLAFLTYWLLPNVRQNARHVLVGALVTSLLWLLATLLFRLYVQRFPPNPAYGVIGGIMILLTWMYYTMFVVLAGGELASELHHGTGAVSPPRGATYYGRIVSGDQPGAPSVSEA
jgi:membrane protein